MIRINLLPVRAAQKKARLQGQLVVLVLVLVATGLICGALYASVSMKISSEQKEIAEIDREIRRLQQAIGEVAQFKKLQEEFQAKLDVLDQLKQRRTGPVRFLDELNRVMPDKLWLESFQESGGSVSIRGVGLDEETVARFMRDLEASPYYTRVDLRVTEQITQAGMKLQRFDLTARTATPTGASTR